MLAMLLFKRSFGFFFKDPDRSPSPVDDDELLTTIEESEEQMRETQELINERMQQMQAILNELQRINHLLQQIQNR